MYNISTLSNGIRVVTENISYVKSVSVGVWIGAGSAMEEYQNNGVSHFIEHMLFKGTQNRTAKEIAEYMDRVGGQLNAVTSKEYTCYYAKTLSEHFEMAFEILSDMIKNSIFSEDSIATERKVIAEEINMSDDTPEDYIHDCLSGLVWRNHALGFPIAGTAESIRGIDRGALLSYRDGLYCGENMVISVVGNFDQAMVMASLEDKFGRIKKSGALRKAQAKLEVVRGADIVKKDIEQCHVCLGLEGFSRSDKRLYDLLVVNSILGGNMSSRLFQRVREEMGLAYSIYSYANTYQNNGSMVIYAGLNTDSLCGALGIIGDEIKTLKQNKLTAEEVSVAKEQMKASAIMGLEGMSSRMSSYGKSMLFENRVYSMDDTVSLIDRVNRDSVADVIDTVFDINRLNLAVLGRIEGEGKNIIDAVEF
ncbi:MAG: insulinase family protein [Clostridia bacterium]|nr:insulinase family protein [Clostridia bacterium]